MVHVEPNGAVCAHGARSLDDWSAGKPLISGITRDMSPSVDLLRGARLALSYRKPTVSSAESLNSALTRLQNSIEHLPEADFTGRPGVAKACRRCKGGESMICSCPHSCISGLEVFDAESWKRAHSPFVCRSHRRRCADCGPVRATGRPDRPAAAVRATTVDGAAPRARASGCRWQFPDRLAL